MDRRGRRGFDRGRGRDDRAVLGGHRDDDAGDTVRHQERAQVRAEHELLARAGFAGLVLAEERVLGVVAHDLLGGQRVGFIQVDHGHLVGRAVDVEDHHGAVRVDHLVLPRGRHEVGEVVLGVSRRLRGGDHGRGLGRFLPQSRQELLLLALLGGTLFFFALAHELPVCRHGEDVVPVGVQPVGERLERPALVVPVGDLEAVGVEHEVAVPVPAAEDEVLAEFELAVATADEHDRPVGLQVFHDLEVDPLDRVAPEDTGDEVGDRGRCLTVVAAFDALLPEERGDLGFALAVAVATVVVLLVGHDLTFLSSGPYSQAGLMTLNQRTDVEGISPSRINYSIIISHLSIPQTTLPFCLFSPYRHA